MYNILYYSNESIPQSKNHKKNLRIFSRKEMDYLVIVKKVKNISIPYFRSSYGFSFSYLPR